MAKYRVEEMRVLAGNADKGTALVIKGKFFDEKGSALAIRSKSISVEEKPLCKINVAKGTLEMPEAQRGRPKKKGLSQEEIDALLSA